MWRRWFCVGCMMAATALAARAADMYVYFGSHGTGPGKGISVSHFDSQTGALTPATFEAQSDIAGYFVIAADGKHLYAANALSTFQGQDHMGALSAYTLDPKNGHLAALNQVPSAGDDPAYVRLDKTGKYLFTANYWGNHVPGEGGTVAVFAIKPDGSIGERTALVQNKGTGFNPVRQNQSFTHSVMLDPSNTLAMVADLGLDKIFLYDFDASHGMLAVHEPPFVQLEPGSGPRHIAFHPNGQYAYVVQEMGNSVTGLSWNGKAKTFDAMNEISTLPPDFKGTNTAAEIEVHPSGKFLYVSNRGHNSIAQFIVDPQTCRLAFAGTVPSGGKTPRNFEIDPTGNWMIVANNDSDNVVVFHIDQLTGQLKQQGPPVTIPNPFCPRFLPVPQ